MTIRWMQFYSPKFVAAALVCALPFLVQFFIQRFRDSRKCGPVKRRNGPKAFPVVGTVLEHLWNWESFHDWLTSYFEKYHTFSAPMHLNKICYYTVDIENIKYILKTNFNNFPKGEMFQERMEDVLGHGIFNVDGEKWKQQRKTASAEFTTRSMRDFYAVAFTEEALKLTALLSEIDRQGVSVDMQDVFMRMTLDSIGKVGFGVRLGTLPSTWQLPLPENAFAKAFDVANNIATKRFIDPTWKLKRFLRVGHEAQLFQSINVIDSFTYDVIAQRKEDISTFSYQRPAVAAQETGELTLLIVDAVLKTANDTARCHSSCLCTYGGLILFEQCFQEPKKDLITRFLKLGQENNSVDYKFIRDVVLNFVIAGRDTTAVTLSWFLYSIIKKPEVAQRLYEELRDFEARKRPVQTSVDVADAEAAVNVANAATAVVGDEIQEFAKLLTYDNLRIEELPYLHAVITETLRLFPPVPQEPKGITDDDVLPDGTRLKGDNIICFSPYGMGRMTYIWGTDAKEFKPERWLKCGTFVPESDFKFIAFQAGQRNCLGKESAYTQMKITAAILCRFFEFQLVEGHRVHYKIMAILAMADGLMVNVKRRGEPNTYL